MEEKKAENFCKSFRHPIKRVSEESIIRGLHEAGEIGQLNLFCENQLERRKKELPKIENFEKVDDTCRFFTGIKEIVKNLSALEAEEFVGHLCAELRYQRSQCQCQE